jgi:hypothetical protein
MNESPDITKVFCNLKKEILIKSINDIFLNKRFLSKIDYKPCNIDANKASYLIENILLKLEIPPMVLFAGKDDEKMEIIIGENYFEAVLKFLNGEIKLVNLKFLKSYEGKDYNELPEDVKGDFEYNSVRLLEYSTSFDLDTAVKNEIKKELYERYTVIGVIK